MLQFKVIFECEKEEKDILTLACYLEEFLKSKDVEWKVKSFDVSEIDQQADNVEVDNIKVVKNA